MGRHTGLPGWAALPAGLAGISLLTAAFGMYWDISLHIDQGRDAGPLANPAHYFILLGLYGILAAGWFAIVLPREDDPRSPAALQIAPDWHVPVGGRAADRVRVVLADRLPARRRLPPPVRAGRHALGTDAPDAARRCRDDAHRHPRAGHGGEAGDARRRRRARRRQPARPPPEPHPRARRLRRPAARPLDLPGRVRLRRPAVRPALPPAADRLRGVARARGGAHADRARGRARRRRLLPRDPRRPLAADRTGARARPSRTSRRTSPRRCSSRGSPSP